jgi:c(7)-type cytochrome triheme protein
MRCTWKLSGRALLLQGWLVAALLLPSVAVGADKAQPDAARLVAAMEVKLPADAVYKRVVGTDSAVVFSHQTHVPLADNKCTGCHPRPYPMLTVGPAPRHADMNSGRTCGMCHDGRKAFGIRDTTMCRTCHAGTTPPSMAMGGASASGAAPGAAPAAATPATAAGRGPAPHAFPASADSPGRVTFRHQTHARGGCTACHPKLFKMAPAPPRPGGGMHEKSSCGACHDGSMAFGVEDSDACTRCHKETGARK